MCRRDKRHHMSINWSDLTFMPDDEAVQELARAWNWLIRSLSPRCSFRGSATFSIERSPARSIGSTPFPETFTDKFRTYRTGRRYAFALGKVCASTRYRVILRS